MKIPKKIKGLPWPDTFVGGREDFKVVLRWPCIDHEKWMVADFVPNRNRRRGKAPFRLVCSKKQHRCAVLYPGNHSGRAHTLRDAMQRIGTETEERWSSPPKPTTCYPYLSETDEAALGKWLGGVRTSNHYMPELGDWVTSALLDEKRARAKARGELDDDDVELCPEELPAGLVQWVRDYVLERDAVLLYDKGNVRGTCYRCCSRVHARRGQRFRQHEITRCPNCGQTVQCVLQGGESYYADYVANVATIQRGTDGETVFIRQWHLCRDYSAEYEDIPEFLEEVCRYAVRGNHAAKWQREMKRTYFMNVQREMLSWWQRVKDTCFQYDRGYGLQFYLPYNWQMILSDTSLQYCDLAGYVHRFCEQGEVRWSAFDPMRFLMDWARYPAVEKIWKAGFTNLVNERLYYGSSYCKEINWRDRNLRTAFPFPYRLLKLRPAEEWNIKDVKQLKTAWNWVQEGLIREKDIPDVLACDSEVAEHVSQALRYASFRKTIKYLAGQTGSSTAALSRTYRDYLRDCETLQLDLSDKSILFPPDLEAAHDRTIDMVKYKENKAEFEAFEKVVNKLRKYAWEMGELLIRPAESQRELITEGRVLHHCVGGYASRMAKGETSIFLIRKKAEQETPFYTLEWKDNKVIQCRTVHNKSYEQDEAVYQFVNDWIKLVMQAKKKTKVA